MATGSSHHSVLIAQAQLFAELSRKHRGNSLFLISPCCWKSFLPESCVSHSINISYRDFSYVRNNHYMFMQYRTYFLESFIPLLFLVFWTFKTFISNFLYFSSTLSVPPPRATTRKQTQILHAGSIRITYAVIVEFNTGWREKHLQTPYIDHTPQPHLALANTGLALVLRSSAEHQHYVQEVLRETMHTWVIKDPTRNGI